MHMIQNVFKKRQIHSYLLIKCVLLEKYLHIRVNISYHAMYICHWPRAANQIPVLKMVITSKIEKFLQGNNI